MAIPPAISPCYVANRDASSRWLQHGESATRRSRSLDRKRKQLLRRDDARCETLLVHKAADRFPGRPVGLDAIGPEILAEDAPVLLDVVDQPRERDPQRIGVVEAVDCNRL